MSGMEYRRGGGGASPVKLKTRIILWAVKRKVAKEVRRLRKESEPMSKVLNGVQWLNVIALVAQTVNNAAGIFPALTTNPYFILVQGILAAVLPNLNGVGHKIAFGETQDPAKR